MAFNKMYLKSKLCFKNIYKPNVNKICVDKKMSNKINFKKIQQHFYKNKIIKHLKNYF